MQALRELRDLVVGHLGPEAHATSHHAELGLHLIAERRPQPELSHHVYERVLAVIVHGEKRIELGDQRFICGAGSFLVSAVDLPVGSR